MSTSAREAPPRTAAHSLAEAFAHAARAVARVLEGASFNAAIARSSYSTGRLRAAAQDLVYGTLRAYGRADGLVDRLLTRPVDSRELYALLLVSIEELESQGAAPHTVVHQAVEAASLLGQARARGLVNAVLRGYLRRAPQLGEELQAIEPARYRHPQWWIDRLRLAFPGLWEGILEQGNTHPPMSLRVNRRKTDALTAASRLAAAGIVTKQAGEHALLLERPCPVETLPGFAAGEVSVQDVGAQLAAPLLDARDGMRVLDACAAPGGKAAHLLELADCRLLAMDSSQERVRLVESNLRRLQLDAEVLVGDALQAGELLAGRSFERILVDAPCTSSGVVRRHPDIKWLRRESDIGRFSVVQSRMLDALWRLLEPGGKLLYATCSVFPEENGDVVQGFLERHRGAARLQPPGLGDGQILPDAASDGFYYALLTKTPC
jgi:16S rRNA (cytosine967-C5)-methyltransferase